MTKAMRSTEAYATLHSKLIQEVRSPLVHGEHYIPPTVEEEVVGQTIHCLMSAAMALCAMPEGAFADDDRTNIMNVVKNLGMLVRRIG